MKTFTEFHSTVINNVTLLSVFDPEMTCSVLSTSKILGGLSGSKVRTGFYIFTRVEEKG